MSQHTTRACITLGAFALFILTLAPSLAAAQGCSADRYACADGSGCCPHGTICGTGSNGCDSDSCCDRDSGGGGGGGQCPAGYPVNCGDGTCCPSNTTCVGNGQCRDNSSGGGGGGGQCPAGYPVSCGDGTCCPSNTTCVGNGQCRDNSSGGGGPSGDATCASDSVGDSRGGSCTIDYCIESTTNDACARNYYIINGQRISCNSCQDIQSCANRAAEICAGRAGASSSGASGTDTFDEGGCSTVAGQSQRGLLLLGLLLLLGGLARTGRRRAYQHSMITLSLLAVPLLSTHEAWAEGEVDDPSNWGTWGIGFTAVTPWDDAISAAREVDGDGLAFGMSWGLIASMGFAMNSTIAFAETEADIGGTNTSLSAAYMSYGFGAGGFLNKVVYFSGGLSGYYTAADSYVTISTPGFYDSMDSNIEDYGLGLWTRFGLRLGTAFNLEFAYEAPFDSDGEFLTVGLGFTIGDE